MSNLPRRNYNPATKDGIGVLTITGLPLEENSYYAPLGKLYSSCRKRNFENYGIQVTGIFMYDYPEAGIITCSFHPNCYDCNDEEAKIKKVLQRFEDTFERQVTLFIDVIECFMDDPDNGYQAYLKHLETIDKIANDHYDSEEEQKSATKAAINDCNNMFDNFLINIGVKTDKDIKRRQRKLSMMQKAKESLKKIEASCLGK